MADLEWLGEPDRASLRRAIRHRLRHLDPTLRVVAEGFLAEQSEIDLLAVGNEGELVSIRIGRRGGDAVLLTQALSDLTWLRPRREHLLKLAPGLGLEPSAEPRALLLCPNFAPETCSAAENLPARTVGRLSYRCLRLQGQLNVLLTDEADPERARPSGTEFEVESPLRPAPFAGVSGGSGAYGGARRDRRSTQRDDVSPSRLTDPPSPSSFRTGLSDADLGRPLPHAKAGASIPEGRNGTESRLT